jgi:hypothetical protein
VANVIKSLANLFLPVHLTVAMELYQTSLDEGVELKHILGDDFQARVLELEAERRSIEG